MIKTVPGRVSGEAFALDHLRRNPQLDYAALQRAADEAGVSIQPIHYGRARRQLGLTATTPGGAAVAPRIDVAEREPAPEPAKASKAPTKETPSPARTGSTAFQFLVEALRADPILSYGELNTRAHTQGFKIAPIMYGRAKALLGLVPVRPRGSRKPAVAAKAADGASAAAGAPAVAAPAADEIGRQLDDVRSVEGLIAIVKRLETERRRLRAVLEQIANSIDDALGYSD